jgi:NAD(P)-dependent dehydrogenase (short-subunit alcohol dehydrogenase family)
MTDPQRFQGRRAVVTGGAAGIGFAIASRIAAESGTVCLWDRDRAAIDAAVARIGEERASGIAVDVASWDEVREAAAETETQLGGIDVLVCSAGITGPNATTWDYAVEDWRQVMDVNLNGLFYCNKAVVPVMRRAGYGRVVNIASVAGKEGNPNAPAYSTSKAGVIGLTKSLGKELAGSGITANCVTPAAVHTAIFDQMTQAHIDFMLSKIPMKRFGEVEEVAALVCWLASPECSFSTGAVFDISGGRATY